MKKEEDDDQITKQIPGSAARSTPPVGKYKKFKDRIHDRVRNESRKTTE
jgi:hypothetical protein